MQQCLSWPWTENLIAMAEIYGKQLSLLSILLIIPENIFFSFSTCTYAYMHLHKCMSTSRDSHLLSLIQTQTHKHRHTALLPSAMKVTCYLYISVRHLQLSLIYWLNLVCKCVSFGLNIFQPQHILNVYELPSHLKLLTVSHEHPYTPTTGSLDDP